MKKNLINPIEKELSMIGKTVGFTVFDQKYFGKIIAFDEKYRTFIIEDFYALKNGQKSTICPMIELDFNDIEEIYTEPIYYYVSKEFQIFSQLAFGGNHVDVIKIPFSTLANNKALLEFTPFVQNQISNDNTKWFAGYLLAFDKYDDYHINYHVAKHFLANNALLMIKMSNDYEFKEQFIETYNKFKLDQLKEK